MSSSFIVESKEDSKKDVAELIIMMSEDGMMTCDQETLQKLIMNQSNANVSVVRYGQTEEDIENGSMTLTLDPPAFTPAETTTSTSTNNVDVEAPLFLDPKDLETLESALQTEEAKHILGANVVAMLDMLSIEEKLNELRRVVAMDHSYTGFTLTTDAESNDSLAMADSSVQSDTALSQLTEIHSHTSAPQNTSISETSSTSMAKPKIANIRNSKTSSGRRSSITKSPLGLKGSTVAHSEKESAEAESEKSDDFDDEPTSSSESSESEPSDDDEYYSRRRRAGRRGGVRSRGGRRGLITRGGSSSSARRRRTSKHLDQEQVKRLDMEMAAAVESMRDADMKDEKLGEKPQSSTPKPKKQVKTIVAKKKEEVVTVEVAPEKPLQTTNQVKAQLINSNMIKGNMILTKPGESRSNQKVFFVQKVMKPEDMKTLGSKKPIIVRNRNFSNSPMRVNTKAAQLPLSPTKLSMAALNQIKMPTTLAQIVSIDPNIVKIGTPVSKTKTPDKKKDRRKSESSDIVKPEAEVVKGDVKIPDVGAKKHLKKEHRKPVTPVESLGPALFSTPDIIRRVGGVENKAAEPAVAITSTAAVLASTSVASVPSSVSMATSVATLPSPVMITMSNPAKSPVASTPAESNPSPPTTSTTLPLGHDVADVYDVSDIPKTPKDRLTSPMLDSKSQPMEVDDQGASVNPMEAKNMLDSKPPTADELQPSLDTGGIEGEEHLLASLQMEESKHEADILTEALLLQEELGVNLGDDSLEEQTPQIPEPLLQSDSLTFVQTPPGISKLDRQSSLQSPVTTPSIDQKRKIFRNEKEPLQIFRGGRLITLPPIEAPATRSKKFQVTTKPAENNTSNQMADQMDQGLAKTRESREKKPSTFLLNSSFTTEIPEEYDDHDEDYDKQGEEDEEDVEDEEDPNKLWCICKKPYNRRFMIACDKCQEWFHGHCVRITKAEGKRMEENNVEWHCPNCKEKDKKGNGGRSFECVVCKKEARESSIYCSNDCILAHAQKSTTKEKPSPSPTVVRVQKSDPTMTPKTLKDPRVLVMDKRTKTILPQKLAPPRSILQKWLKEHPNFELVHERSLNNLKVKDNIVRTIAINDPSKVRIVSPQQKSPTVDQAKMVYAKVPNSKQTVLAPSKKVTTLSPTVKTIILPQNRVKPSSPSALKQTTLKMFSPPVKSQIPGAKFQTSTPKSQSVTPKVQTLTPKLQTLMPKPQTVTPKIQALTPKPSSLKKQEPKQREKQPSTPKLTPIQKKLDNEPIRENVRKTLAEAFTARIKDAEDLKLPEEEIVRLTTNIELELFKYFRDTGQKYKAKYRSLMFNIRDPKNLIFFRKIADKSLTPDVVVKLEGGEMASQELTEWRERETKHQLEMIQKNELEMIAQAKTIVVKTHKGEQVIEKERAVDANASVQEIVTSLNSSEAITSMEAKDKTLKMKDTSKELSKKKKDKDMGSKQSRDRGKKRHRDSSEGKGDKRRSKRSRDSKSKSKDSKKDREKDRELDRSQDKSLNRSHSKDKSHDHSHSKDKSHDRKKHKHSKSKHHEHRDRDDKKGDDEKRRESLSEKKKKEPSVPLTTDKPPIEDRLWRHIDEETTTNTIDGNDSDVSDREPTSTVIIKTPDINEEPEPEPEMVEAEKVVARGPQQTVWRGYINMSDVAKFFISAQEVSGYSLDLSNELPDTLDVVGRVSHNTVWEYLYKMRRNSTKEILVIRLTAANDEEKIPYITLYSYLNSRGRLGVMASKCSRIKDFYIMPLPGKSQIPSVLLPFEGPGFEENRADLLLGIIVRTRQKRSSSTEPVIPAKMAKKEERSYTPPPLVLGVKENKPQYDSATISKIVPELSSKIDFSTPPLDKPDDEDEPYSPGSSDDCLGEPVAPPVIENNKEFDQKLEELNRQIEEHKMQIETISSTYHPQNTSTLPGFGTDPPEGEDEAYSPTAVRSFTPPPLQGIAKLAQPILDKVSDITIPANLQEILANVKRQETAKVDPYIPSKPSATFLTSTVKFSPRPMPTKCATAGILSKLSDSDMIRIAEEQFKASSIQLPDLTRPPPPLPFPVADQLTTKAEVAKSPIVDEEYTPTLGKSSRWSGPNE